MKQLLLLSDTFSILFQTKVEWMFLNVEAEK